jgi:arylsulfatase A-like enzyme
MIDYIEEQGHSVTLVADENAPPVEVAEKYALVWISASVNHSAIGGKYRSADVPIGSSEALIYRSMGMANRSGFAGQQTRVRSVSTGDVVATTSQAVSYAWGKVSGDADVVAVHRSAPNKSLIFHYDAGAVLADGTVAVQCRAGFFAAAQAPKVLTPAGRSLLDSVIQRLIDCAVPRVPNEVPTLEFVEDQYSTEGTSVSLNLEASDPDPGDSLQFSVDPLPPGLSVDIDTGLISGEISHRGADGSPYSVVATVTDSDGASDSVSFQWTVADDPGVDPPPVEAPNVLVIMTDDQTVEQMRWLPSVLRYMDDGVHYVNSITNYPLCGPSRVTLLTGQYATNHGLECNKGLAANFRSVQQDSLAPWLQAAGVHTIHVGKYLNGYGGRESTRYIPDGWSDWRALAGASAYNYTRFDMVLNGQYRQFGRNGDVSYSTDVLTDQLDDALRQAPTDQPFFAVFTPLAPHYQGGKNYAVPAPRHEDMISDVLRSPNYDSCRGQYECPATGSDLLRPKLTSFERTWIDNGYQTASESLLAVDESFEVITATLAELDRLQDTVIIFTSDNGFLYGEHGIERGKRVAANEALFVPLYIKGPGFDQPRTELAPVSNADLAPTIVDLFGAQPTLTMDGRSLLGPLDPQHAILFQAKQQSGTVGYQGVYADGWIYIDWLGDGRNGLYGPSDIWQMETLDNDDEWNAVESELGALTNQLSRCQGVSCHVNWVAPD